MMFIDGWPGVAFCLNRTTDTWLLIGLRSKGTGAWIQAMARERNRSGHVLCWFPFIEIVQ